MKPPRFQYLAPPTVNDAVGFLAEHGGDAKLLAGGQSLMPVLNMRLARPAYLVDLNAVDGLDRIDADERSGGLRIGAMTSHESLMESDLVRERCPLLSAAIPFIGHTAIRYRGTLGGSLVHADPSAELPAVMTVLGAEIELRSKGASRTVPASEFFVTFFTTAADPAEAVVEIRLPAQPQGEGSSVQELARRSGDFALAGVAATARSADGKIEASRICAFGVDEVPRRLEEIERLVAGQPVSDELLAEAGRRAAELVEPESDMHASGQYRKEMTGVLTTRALRQALEATDGAA